MTPDPFWSTFDQLIKSSRIVIDRPRDSVHPRYPDLVYPLDYGYVADTVSGDGHGIDVWIGSQGSFELMGILCTFDTVKRDAEIKLLLGCIEAEVEIIRNFNPDNMRYLFIPKPI